ncbi:MAG: TIGR03936 family radical SAM-associated protein [Gemmatales bacterium]|nr:TIGR03936 family radical SAM-associated protein [Gemmatales bacterium]MDW7994974.1 TIGR03936 family radical SAM-associated protein [Gemmatales bacterium]
MTTRTKARIRFRKAGDLRFFSHHDLARMFERMLRRAALPVRMSEGFHPMPRIAFASALGLGIIGWEEVVEIEFTEPLTPSEIEQRLREQAHPDLVILSVELIEAKRKAQPIRSVYRFRLPEALLPLVQERLAQLHQQEQWWVERVRVLEGGAQRPDSSSGDIEVPLVAPIPRRQVRSIDIRSFVERLWIEDGALYFSCAITSKGTARPEEILRLLDLEHLLDEGYVLERVRLQLADEPMSEVSSS